ncbi:hAT dimerization domain-containing protein/transposase-related [Abeliophyllum distichum]|uniref:HAT dimerization domain-containing protein/transposase-related n=1 Tax=Abeliophyllum distichum TaxID=126358 RepID=A0ABD1QWA7_9LAMI
MSTPPSSEGQSTAYTSSVHGKSDLAWEHFTSTRDNDVKIVAPLIRLLHIVDVDEKPSLGYVYDGMDREEKTIKNIFLNKERFYKPYIDIIDERWDKHFRHDIHVAVYFLNPAFIYDEGFCHEWSPLFA